MAQVEDPTAVLRDVMDNPANLRNVSFVGARNHGMSTLMRQLCDEPRPEEHLFTTTVASTSFKHVEAPDVLVNIVDPPGHMDFYAETTAALRVTDGAVLVVDCVEGVGMQTESKLRHVFTERVVPVVVINKLDRVFVEFEEQQGERTFQQMKNDLDAIAMAARRHAWAGKELTPRNGSVVFASGSAGWAFALPTFSRLYAAKFHIDEAKVTERLWGDHFYDGETKRWIQERTSASGKPLQRGFVQFVLEPLQMVVQAVKDNDMDRVVKLLGAVGVLLTAEDRELRDGALLQRCMHRWLPATPVLRELVTVHLPSPRDAQQHRMEQVFQGPLDHPAARGFQTCDPSGPLVLYVSEMIPSSSRPGQSFALGRVFSGTVRAGQTVRLLGRDYVPGRRAGVFHKPVRRVLIQCDGREEYVETAPCGNIVLLEGLDQFIVKSCTITDADDLLPLRALRLPTPVVCCHVLVVHPCALPELVEAFRKLANTDLQAVCSVDQMGQHVLQATGELHLEECLATLRRNMHGIALTHSHIHLAYRETVTQASTTCVAQSPNKHNRIRASVEPLSPAVCDAIEHGGLASEDPRVRGRRLEEEFDFKLGRRVWAFGPVGRGEDEAGANVLVDATTSCQYLHEAKDSMCAAFEWTVTEGPLAGEPMLGVRFNIQDVILMADAIHRGAGQVMPACRRVFHGSFLMAEPRLLEPVYRAEVVCNGTNHPAVMELLARCRGRVLEQTTRADGALLRIKAYLPVSESIGIAAQLDVHGAKCQCVFDHWAPLDHDTSLDVTRALRRRKGLPESPPTADVDGTEGMPKPDEVLTKAAR